MKKLLLTLALCTLAITGCSKQQPQKHIKTVAEFIVETEFNDGYYIRTGIEYLDDHYIWLSIDSDMLENHKVGDELVMTYTNDKTWGSGYYFDYWC